MFCTGGETTASPTGQECPQGFFCDTADENTSFMNKHPCPPGYKASGAAAGAADMASACTICDQGYYCYGADIAQAQCPGGYFCPAGTKSPTQYPCPAGTYSDNGAWCSDESCGSGNSCKSCSDGFYCPLGTKDPYQCPPGQECTSSNGLRITADENYCSQAGFWSDGTSCNSCTANHYCPRGTPYPLKCPAGTKSSGGAESAFECELCASGEYCPMYG